MTFWHKVFWGVLAAVQVILILAILGLAALAPKPQPVPLGKPALPPLRGVSAVSAMAAPGRESAALKFAVDASSSQRVGNYQKLTGWIFIENQETAGQNVYVQLEKPDGAVVRYTTTPQKRPDVGAAFRNPLYDAAGFSALIPLKNERDFDGCTVRLVVQNHSGTYAGPAWRPGIRFSSRVEIRPPQRESREVVFALDANRFKKTLHGCRYLAGWVLVRNQPSRGQEVYVEIEKPDGTIVHYTSFPRERPDVGAAFKNPLYNASGFTALIPLTEGIDFAACAVRLVVKNKGGMHKSAPWKGGRGRPAPGH